jgi:hypothetical protein
VQVVALPSHRRVVLRGGLLDGESRSVLMGARRSWFKPRLSDRRVEYRQDTNDPTTWWYVGEEGGKK